MVYILWYIYTYIYRFSLYICVCTIWTDVKLLPSFPVDTQGAQVWLCANEGRQKSQWYQRETSLWRTCSDLFIWFRESWHGAKPRTPTWIYLFVIFHRHGRGLSRELCDEDFPGYYWVCRVYQVCRLHLSGMVTAIWSHHDLHIVALLFVYYFKEIYFRSMFLIQLHVRGFSSHQIT
jgi:hypothetical protein